MQSELWLQFTPESWRMFFYPLFSCIVALDCSSEVTRGNWLSTGRGWILLCSGIMKRSISGISGVFLFFSFLGFLSLHLGSLSSSLYPQITPAQIWLHWEYSMNTLFFLNSNSKLEIFFSCLATMHCDWIRTAIVWLWQYFDCATETNKRGGNKKKACMQTRTQLPTIKHTHTRLQETNPHKDTQTIYK